MVIRAKYDSLWSVDCDGKSFFVVELQAPLTYKSFVIRKLGCSGYIKEYNKGFPLTLEGELVESNNRINFNLKSYSEDIKNGNFLKDYLSKYIENIGKVKAERI